MTTDGPRLRGDLGVVGGIEAIPFGVLAFLVGALLAANAWAVVDVKLAVTSASREAVRRYVEAPDHRAAVDRAIASMRQTISAHGRDPDRARVRIEHQGDRPWARCTRVALTVSYPVPTVRLPWIGGYGHAFDVRATHSEIVDPFRGGLPGVGTC